MNLINGAMDLDQLELSVYQHHTVDRSRCESGDGDPDADDDDGGAG